MLKFSYPCNAFIGDTRLLDWTKKAIPPNHPLSFSRNRNPIIPIRLFSNAFFLQKDKTLNQISPIMRILTLLFASVLFTLNSLQAQTPDPTYVLNLKWLPSEYGNKLGIHTPATLKTQFPDWKQVDANGTYTIELSFLSELDPKQYTRKRESGPVYFFQVKYNTPSYLAEIKNKNGETIFKQTYGGEKRMTEYGKKEEQSDPDELATQWRKNRDIFYKEEENNFNNIDSFLPELVTLFGGGEAMLVVEETIESAIQENIPSTIDDTIIEDEIEETVSTEISKTNPSEESEKVVAAIATPEPVEKVEPEIVETPEEKARRIREVNRQWEAEEEAAIKRKKEKDGRPRHFRLGLRLLVPNVAGVHGEIVTPLAHNRFSLVGDFSTISFGQFVERFLDEGESFGDEIDGRYQYYSVGANYYFRKQYARGWYVGSSYMKGQAKTSTKVDNATGSAKVTYEAVSARLGLNTGRKAFMFGFEIGAGVPIKNLEGEILIVDNSLIEVEKVDEKIPIIPVLNITFGVAF